MEAAGGNTPQPGDLPRLSLGKNVGQKIHLNIRKSHKMPKKYVGPRVVLGFVPLSPGKAAAVLRVCGKGRNILKSSPQNPQNLSKNPTRKLGLGKVWAWCVKGFFLNPFLN